MIGGAPHLSVCGAKGSCRGLPHASDAAALPAGLPAAYIGFPGDQKQPPQGLLGMVWALGTPPNPRLLPAIAGEPSAAQRLCFGLIEPQDRFTSHQEGGGGRPRQLAAPPLGAGGSSGGRRKGELCRPQLAHQTVQQTVPAGSWGCQAPRNGWAGACGAGRHAAGGAPVGRWRGRAGPPLRGLLRPGRHGNELAAAWER